jgi:Domain of unknown function (DUF2020)
VRIGILLALGAGLLAGGCDTAGRDSAAPVPTTAAPTTPRVPTTATAAAGSTVAPSTTPARPVAPTVEAPCPYADAPTVMDIVGQHIARTTVTRTTPHPGCAFYRPNGERAAEVAVSVLPTATAAQAEAIRLPGPGANPVDSVGDGGAVAITDDGALLAVSKGTALVVVRINQHISLEAVELAKLVVAGL